MTDFVSKVGAVIREFDMFVGKDSVVAALSGGADSVSLLLALSELKDTFGVTLSACHFNHGLRGGESDRDERFCAELCERLEVPLFKGRADVKALQKKHESVEECARRVRYAFFDEVKRKAGENAVIATAHNCDDCAETVLLNLMRGTGLKGLCGVPPVRNGIVRPLIRCTRQEVERFCDEKGERYVTDSTNLTDDCTRNKIRHIILPEMKKINSSLLYTMSRMIDSLREDCAYLDGIAKEALDAARTGKGWDAKALSELPRPIKSRAVREILSDGGIEPSALRINTAISLLDKRSARFNPCRDRFFTIRKGICFVEMIEQHYRKWEKADSCDKQI